MQHTKVDDLLIEMITPKLKEIEERFSRGEGLTQDDINTLLLKSQYNHINHLDMKLDDVTQSVMALEGKFSLLEGKFETFTKDVELKIEKAMNKNIIVISTILGVFLTLTQFFEYLAK